MDKTIALYMRLSDEDDNLAAHEESNSISHQRKLMLDHIQKLPELKGCNILEFADDGYSGADFNRPNFVKMMDLVKGGKIQVIVTKDYSRLGRDYLEVGNYMECIFPVLQVRYISVNDNYDSANSFGSTGGMSVALKNLVNALYCKDASKKVRAAKAVLAKQGKYIASFAPFGYKKSEDDNLAAHEESNSISHQRKLMLDHIQKLPELKDCNIMEFSDDGYSGADFSRPNFVKMMDLVKAGKIQVIVTKDYSRLGRDYLEVGNYMECIFPVLKVRYISVNDNYDSANSFGSTGGMSVALKNLVNALYCKDASKKVRAAKAVLAKQGKYIAAFAPFGYQKSEDDKHMLVPDPVTAPVVQQIFELAIKGMKYTEIANYLNNNGYDSIFEYYQKIGVKRCYDRDIGEHMWSASTVMEILYNEVYIGSVINNKTADNIDTGHQVVQRDKEDWIIVENCHEPLVSVEDFKLAHKIIARREVTKRKPNGKWRKSYIRCGICGKGLCKYGNKSSYRCHNGHVSRIRGKELEAALLDIARNMALSQLHEFELKTNSGNCPDNLEREIESLKKSKAHYAKLKFEIYDDYTKANITRDQMAKKTAEVKQKIAEIESLITEKQETLDMQKDLFLDAKQEQLTKLSKLDEFDEEVIRYLIDYVLVYDNEHIEIRWNFDDFQAG